MSEQDTAESGNATDDELSAEDGAPTENGSEAADEGDAVGTAGESTLEAIAALRDEFDGAVDDGLIDHVEESDTGSVAEELAALRTRVEDLEAELDEREAELSDREAELDEVTSQLKRKQADFENYKKRMKKRREREKQRATEDLVERLLDVRDNLGRALAQEDPTAEDFRDGVDSIRREFDRVLEDENVEIVEPDPGTEVDPERHEVLMRVDSDQPGDTIADVHRPGYVMAERVLRPAQVTVSEGDAGGDES